MEEKVKGKGWGREEREGKGLPVPDWESEKVATLLQVRSCYGFDGRY